MEEKKQDEIQQKYEHIIDLTERLQVAVLDFGELYTEQKTPA